MTLKEMEDLLLNSFHSRKVSALPYNKLVIEPGNDPDAVLVKAALDSLVRKGILRKDGIIFHLTEN